MATSGLNGGLSGNPYLDEINALSPGAKAALAQAHQQAAPVTAAASAPPAPTSVASAPLPIAKPIPQAPALGAGLNPVPPAGRLTVENGPPQRGTLEGDQAHRTDLLSHPAGLESVYGRIAHSDFGQNHPILGKVLGGLAQAPLTALDVGLSAGLPRVAAAIPGTSERHGLQIGAVNKQIGAEEGEQEKEAQTREQNASAAEKENPQPKPKEESWKELPGYTGPNGEPLEIEQNSGQTRPIQNAKSAPSKVEGEQPLGNIENLNGALEDRFHVLNPGQPLPAQYKLGAGATQKDYDRVDKALESIEKAKGTIAQQAEANAIREQTLALARERLNDTEKKQGKPTADEQRRADLSENLNENLGALEEIVNRRPELFGPLAGRWTELRGKFGSDDPDIGALQTIEHQIGMAQISAHGMRSATGIQTAADSIMNHMHSSPKALLASIDAARNSVKTFQGDVDKATGKTPAGGDKDIDDIVNALKKK